MAFPWLINGGDPNHWDDLQSRDLTHMHAQIPNDPYFGRFDP